MKPGGINRQPIILIAREYARGRRRAFGIKERDRLSHFYAVGRTGVGKTTMLAGMIRQDIERGEGLTVIDPHGDMVAAIAEWVPKEHRGRLIHWDAADPICRYGYNPLKRIPEEQRPLAASGMMEVFRKLWGEKAWGQRMEYILRNALLALLDQPEADLTDIQRLLTDKRFRAEAARRITHPPVRDFWQKEFKGYSYRYRAEAIAPIQSKVGAFLADPRLYRMLIEPEKPLSLRNIMDEGKILLVNLAIGRLGSDSAALLGGLLVTTIGLAAMSRADMSEAERRNHWLYIDEFQLTTTLSLANMLSELRKYHLGICASHQYLRQLDPDIRHAVLGNMGTLISFRVGAEDAPFLARELGPPVDALDLVRLPNYEMYVKLLIDGIPSKAFSARTAINLPYSGHLGCSCASCQ